MKSDIITWALRSGKGGYIVSEFLDKKLVLLVVMKQEASLRLKNLDKFYSKHLIRLTINNYDNIFI
jgi:hypothetical protein